jgi:hypothetical protein
MDLRGSSIGGIFVRPSLLRIHRVLQVDYMGGSTIPPHVCVVPLFTTWQLWLEIFSHPFILFTRPYASSSANARRRR